MPDLRFFGSTVDAIAPQEQNVLSQFRTHNWQVEAANAAAAERARQASMDAWRFGQQNEQQQAQQDYANRINLAQFADRSIRDTTGENLDLYKFEALRKDAARREATVAQLRREEIKATSDARKNPVEERLAQYEDKRAQDMADSGEWNDVAHILSVHPTIPTALAKQYAIRSAQVRASIDAEDAQVKSAANTLNQYQKLLAEQKALATPNTFGDWAHAGTPNADLKARAEAISAKLKAIGPGYQKFTDPKNPISTLLNFDPVAGEWTPAIPVRPWQVKSAAPVTQFAPSTTAPSIPRVDLSQFSTATNAPVAAPAILAPQTSTVLPAPINPAQRQVGQIYQTPRGPMRWQGRGWSTL